MSVLESLQVSLYGFAVVFIVLIALSVFVVFESKLVQLFEKNAKVTQIAATTFDQNVNTILQTSGASNGELRLEGVDEKTAAMIMAIVSDESQIPVSQLIFKSIKAID